jgi:hypothetical protein
MHEQQHEALCRCQGSQHRPGALSAVLQAVCLVLWLLSGRCVQGVQAGWNGHQGVQQH